MENISFDKNKWSIWLQGKNLSLRTIREYNRYLQLFDFGKLSQEYFNSYIVKNNNCVARAFLKNLIHYIRSNDFPSEVKGLVSSLEINKSTGREKKRLPNVLTIENINSVANAMDRERSKLMLLVCFYGGLRISELLMIKPYDFNWNMWLNIPDKQGILRIIGKGNKERKVFIPAKVMARLYQWIKNELTLMQKDASKPIFNISDTLWKNILHEAVMKAIGRHINPHLIRHSTGSWLVNNDWNLREIADYLGHESVNTTQIYTHINQEKIKEKFAQLVAND